MASSNDSLQLHLAVKAGDEEKVKELLSKSKETGLHNIDEEDPNGFTPLIEACVAGNESLVKLLLNSGCSAQPPSGSRHTPLRGACVSGQAHLIPVLIEAGADVNGVSDGHRTPLMGACFLRPNASVEKSVLCTKALLTDPRTDPTIRNSFGETAMDLAKIRGYEESITLIKEALEQAKWLPSNFVVAGRPYWSNDNDCPQKPVPTRDDEDCFLFADFPDFRPSLSPEQVLKAGAFGGTYFRSISSKTAGKTFKVGSHLEFPQDWFEGMNVEKMVTSASYRKEVNKYGVKSGNDLEFWERKGWMRKQDPYGWVRKNAVSYSRKRPSLTDVDSFFSHCHILIVS